jgi:sialic acid synthase
VTYLIAEIGQNHQGSVEIAKDLCAIAASPSPHSDPNLMADGVNAVKMTKRDLDWEMTERAANALYVGKHAFGQTYGAHRARLELSYDEHWDVYGYAKDLGLDFIETVCAPSCIEPVLDCFIPDAFKVASRDLTNDRLLEAIAETRLPVILSTGMVRDWRDVQRALLIFRHAPQVTLMHCLSQYPARPDLLNMRRLLTLREFYPEHRIGYSDHSVGLVASVIAVSFGADVIEKHITLDRGIRGSDHAGALDRGGIFHWVRDVRLAEAMVEPVIDADRLEAVADAQRKLERSVAVNVDVEAGSVLEDEMLVPLSPGVGVPWSERGKLVGRRAVSRIPARSLVVEGLTST